MWSASDVSALWAARLVSLKMNDRICMGGFTLREVSVCSRLDLFANELARGFDNCPDSFHDHLR